LSTVSKPRRHQQAKNPDAGVAMQDAICVTHWAK
jgi:hypothetical protein